MVADPVSVYDVEDNDYWAIEEQRERDLEDIWKTTTKKKRHFSEYTKRRILELGRKGVPSKEIARVLEVSNNSVREHLRKAEIVPITIKQSVPKGFRELKKKPYIPPTNLDEDTKLTIYESAEYRRPARLLNLTSAMLVKELLASPDLKEENVIPRVEEAYGLEKGELVGNYGGLFTTFARSAAFYILDTQFGNSNERLNSSMGNKEKIKLAKKKSILYESLAIMDEAEKSWHEGEEDSIPLEQLLKVLFGKGYERRPTTLETLVGLYNEDLVKDSNVKKSDIEELTKRIFVNGYFYADETFFPIDFPRIVNSHPEFMEISWSNPTESVKSGPGRFVRNSYTLIKEIIASCRYDGPTFFGDLQKDEVLDIQWKAFRRLSDESYFPIKNEGLLVSRDAVVRACINELKKDSPLNGHGATEYIRGILFEKGISSAKDKKIKHVLDISMPLYFGDKRFYSPLRLEEAVDKSLDGF
jgi:hypothetical protein